MLRRTLAGPLLGSVLLATTIAIGIAPDAHAAIVLGPIAVIGPAGITGLAGITDDGARILVTGFPPAPSGVMDLSSGAIEAFGAEFSSGDGRFGYRSSFLPTDATDTDGLDDIVRIDVATSIETSITAGLQNPWRYSATDASSSGRFLAISATSPNFTDRQAQRLDTQTGVLTALDAPLEADGTNLRSIAVGISDDGRYTLIRVLDPASPHHGYHRHDADTGALVRVDQPPVGAPATGYANWGARLADGGRHVVFAATNGSANFVFVRSVDDGTSTLIDSNTGAMPTALGGLDNNVSISKFGDRVAFLKSPGTGIVQQGFVWDRAAGASEQVTLLDDGSQPQGQIFQVVLNDAGSRVFFTNGSTGFRPGSPTPGGVVARDLGPVPPPTTTTTTPTTTVPPNTTPKPALVAPAVFAPLSPQRILDTRIGGHTADGRFEGIGRQRPGTRLVLDVAGRGGVPLDAIAAVLNVTVVDPSDGGYATVWPCDSATPPNASNLNFAAGQTVPNLVITRLSPQGTACLEVAGGAADLLVDANATVPVNDEFTASTPVRMLDTRLGGATIDDRFEGLGATAAGTTLVLELGGRAGIPAAATAVALNVTVTGPEADGYLTVWPCDTDNPPNASNLNFSAGQTVPNLVVTKLSPTGTVCLQTTRSGGDLLADLTGWFTSSVSYHAISPGRVLDSRSGGETIDGRFADLTGVAAGSTLELEIAGRAAVPGRATMVALNVTAVGGGSGYVTIWPCASAAEPAPDVSSLNLTSGPVANLVLAPLTARGTLCLQVRDGSAALIADVSGYVVTPQ